MTNDTDPTTLTGSPDTTDDTACPVCGSPYHDEEVYHSPELIASLADKTNDCYTIDHNTTTITVYIHQ